VWEAPQKSQQVWFIKLLGANVNLGNIPPNEVIPLETLRIGLRGDTFFLHLPEEKRIEVKNIKLDKIKV
jgi:phosphosulfolactate synthase